MTNRCDTNIRTGVVLLLRSFISLVSLEIAKYYINQNCFCANSEAACLSSYNSLYT